MLGKINVGALRPSDSRPTHSVCGSPMRDLALRLDQLGQFLARIEHARFDRGLGDADDIGNLSDRFAVVVDEVDDLCSGDEVAEAVLSRDDVLAIGDIGLDTGGEVEDVLTDGMQNALLDQFTHGAGVNTEQEREFGPGTLFDAAHCSLPLCFGLGPAAFVLNSGGCSEGAESDDQMPVILAPGDYARWLSDEPDPCDLMCPFPGGWGLGSGAADERPSTCATGRKSLAEIAVAGRATPLAVPATRFPLSIGHIPGFQSRPHWGPAPICRP